MPHRMTLDTIVTNKDTLLGELKSRQAIVRDYVKGVARQYTTGCYIYGPPGTAKTYTIRRVLEDEIREIYAYRRGHITPLGLFEVLREYREDVTVLDDVSYLFRSDVALQILLAALERGTARDFGRRVEYRRHGHAESFHYTGGLICISNLELHDDELLSAFKSRVNVLSYAPRDDQLGALMLDAASRGWPPGAEPPTIPPEAAGEAAKFVIELMLERGSRFDLRLLFNKALPAYQQVKDGEADSSWRDLVRASIEEHLVAPQHTAETPLSREARLAEERAVVREIVKECKTREEQVRAWSERTGKSERAFYRRRAEIDDR